MEKVRFSWFIGLVFSDVGVEYVFKSHEYRGLEQTLNTKRIHMCLALWNLMTITFSQVIAVI